MITAQNSPTNQSTFENIMDILNKWGDFQYGTFGDIWCFLYFNHELYVTDKIPTTTMTLKKLIMNMVKIKNESTMRIYATKRVFNLNQTDIEAALVALLEKDSMYDFVNLDWKDRFDFLESY